MHTQQFKGKQLTYTKVKNNILRVWNVATNDDKFNWYQNAYDQAVRIVESVDNELPIEDSSIIKVVGVIASLSPLTKWSVNLEKAEEFVNTGNCKHIGQFKRKAKAIIESDGNPDTVCDILSGNKITSFFLNILRPHDSTFITIDRHALSIALGYKINPEDYQGITKNQYDFFVKCYVLAAEKVGVPPLLMQSATWVRFRKLHNIK